MDNNNKRLHNGIYTQFEQDDLAHPYRTDDRHEGTEAWLSMTDRDVTREREEEAYSQKAYEQDYAIQESEKNAQKLDHKLKRKDSRFEHRCKGNKCNDMPE